MSLSRRRFIAITATSALTAGAARADQTAIGAHWRGIALGAQADLRIAGMQQRDAQRLIDAARAEISRLENIFSLYRSGSDLALLNASGAAAAPKHEMLELLGIAGSLHEATNGLFDPTIQALWRTYAEHRGTPPAAAIDHAMARTGWRHVEFGPSGIRLPNGLQLTLNGIAQGYITDRVMQLLRASGLKTGVVAVGEVAVVGNDGAGAGWPLHLVDAGLAGPVRHVRLIDRAAATSAPSGTLIGEASHIIDPRTGRPAPSRWSRVSVIHKSATLADGLSTAGVLTDKEELLGLILAMGGQLDAVASDGSHVTS